MLAVVSLALEVGGVGEVKEPVVSDWVAGSKPVKDGAETNFIE